MNEPFELADPSYYVIGAWERIHPGLIAGFTTRNGGVSPKPFDSLNFGLHTEDAQPHVIENRKILSGKLGVPLENWVFGEQVHGKRIAAVDEADKGKGTLTYDSSIKGVDGLLTDQTGIMCAAFYADCTPLFFFDPKKKRIGIGHAGWKGTVQDISGEMIAKFLENGSEREDILAVIGPCISGDCYEVDERVVSNLSPDEREYAVQEKENGRFLLDLKKLNAYILKAHGLPKENISTTEMCTFRDQEHFYSYRRDKRETGRMVGFIGFK